MLVAIMVPTLLIRFVVVIIGQVAFIDIVSMLLLMMLLAIKPGRRRSATATGTWFGYVLLSRPRCRRAWSARASRV